MYDYNQYRKSNKLKGIEPDSVLKGNISLITDIGPNVAIYSFVGDD